MKIYKTKKEAKLDNARIFSNRNYRKEIVEYDGGYGKEYIVKYQLKTKGIISCGEGYLYREEIA